MTRSIRAAKAIDMARVAAAGTVFAKDLLVALGTLGLVLATSVQVMPELRPVGRLRLGIADIR